MPPLLPPSCRCLARRRRPRRRRTWRRSSQPRRRVGARTGLRVSCGVFMLSVLTKHPAEAFDHKQVCQLVHFLGVLCEQQKGAHFYVLFGLVGLQATKPSRRSQVWLGLKGGSGFTDRSGSVRRRSWRGRRTGPPACHGAASTCLGGGLWGFAGGLLGVCFEQWEVGEG